MNGLKIRKSVRNSDPEIGTIRDTFSAGYRIMDDRGYGYLAGIHGYPLPIYCAHGNNLFLPWHRAYLQLMERTLSDIDGDFFIPWWDWTSAASHRDGVPESYGDEQIDGVPNALNSAPMQHLDQNVREQFFRFNLSTSVDDPHTLRQPGNPDALPTKSEIRSIMGATTYSEFNQRLESGPHNFIHGWIGRTMGAVPSAGFDPIFWAHHCMIDRLWYMWQLEHPNALPPRNIMEESLPPSRLKVKDVLDIDELGYTYASDQIA